MSASGQFILDFLSQFFKSFFGIFEELFKGLLQMFNVVRYVELISEYGKSSSGAKVLVIIFALVLLIISIGLLVFLIVLLIKRIIKYKKKSHEQDVLLEEVENLNYENIKLRKENEKYIAMANSNEIEYDEDGNPIEKPNEEGESRFYRLTKVDNDWADYVPEELDKSITLNEFCDNFRNYAASELHLYYNIDLIRLFVSAFGSNRLIILQGISGTGKTSLAYAFGSFLNNESIIIPVQPSWRDRAELFGYFNEFTKKFNETELLTKMYEASFNDRVYVSILDEMNIARVEYYFAEMLSIMEMPSYDEWIIDLVPNPWANDPKKLVNGKFQIPKNMWYIGTINNDDSTFMVTDKVYDRALPIDINEKAPSFDAPHTAKAAISSEYFLSLYEDAKRKYPVKQELIDMIGKMDDYVIEHFRLSFGNRIMMQIRAFIPAFVACGGDEVVALDYLICHKILRKFEQLNMSYIRNEVDGFVDFLDNLFGKDKMSECKKILN